MGAFSADWALLDDGWARDALIEHSDGMITGVGTGRVNAHLAGAVLPGMVNLHSHAFQRGFAGSTEFAGGGGDFWSWREAMYRAASAIDPDTMVPVAAYLAMLCLQGGFSSLVEFHYLQNRPDGYPYADRAAMADAVVEGAQQAGIGLTLLFGLYETGDFGGAPLQGGQIRFQMGPDDALRMLSDALPRQTAALRYGLAPHSLRAVPPASLKAAASWLSALDIDAPLHIHAAEQRREVEASIAALGAAPVAWLLANAPVGPNWCLIHATHTTREERLGMAHVGAVAGLCPSTEGNLGDGLFTLPDFVDARGMFGVGTDSHVSLDAFAELRLLEYTQRLRSEKRNTLAGAAGHSGRVLWQAACAGGAQAAARPVGAIRAGRRADMVVIGPTPETEHMPPDFWLDAAMFATDRAPVRHVMAGGEWLVQNGAHVRQRAITDAYRAALQRLDQ
jgi:formimidoylglutamate deiminase